MPVCRAAAAPGRRKPLQRPRRRRRAPWSPPGDTGPRRGPQPTAQPFSGFSGDTVNDFPGSGLFARTEAEYTGPRAESRYVIPRFVERTSQGVREYDPYAKLFEERVIFLGVQIDDASANDVMAQLLCLESMDPDRDISVYINSPGGSFTALTAIYDTMQFVKPDVQTVCMGQAASAAAILLAAGTPGKRMALPNARVLIHQPYSETGRGQVSDLEIAANEILRMRSQLEDMLAKHSTTPIEKIREDIERDKILTAEDALAYGLIDQIISTRKMNNSAVV
nr:ATP-dependent Clp protease proteolytic subunit [Streptomyces sp. SID14446]